MNPILQAYSRKMTMLRDLREAFYKLREVNSEPAFRVYREQYLELILAILTAFAVLDIILSQGVEYVTSPLLAGQVLWIRSVLLAIIAGNFSVYLFLYRHSPPRWFVYPLFYALTLFSPLIGYFSGGIENSFRFEIIFILVTWFMLIPFSYRTLIVHALIMVAAYTALMFLLFPAPGDTGIIIEHTILFFALFVLGVMVAIFNNIFSASVFLSEQRIAKSERRFRMFTQNSLDVVWTMDIQSGHFTYVSPSVYNLRGYHPEEIVGTPVEDSLTPESKVKVREMLDRAGGEIRKGNKDKVVIGELEQFTRSGDTVWIEAIVSFVTDEEGEILEVVGDSRNITERKRAEAELLKIQEQLKEKSEKLQQENLRIQYESLKNQINPHFLFNSLNVLTSLIKLDPGLAEKFTEQMAKVYRYVLEHKEEDTVSLQTELDFIRSYIFLLEIRFQGKVFFDINIAGQYLNCDIPPLTVQLLIENAVKHNVFSRKEPLKIALFVDGDQYLNIVNNLQKREVRMGSTAVGLKNILDRYRQLTEMEPEFGERGEEFVARIPLL